MERINMKLVVPSLEIDVRKRGHSVSFPFLEGNVQPLALGMTRQLAVAGREHLG